MKINRDFLEKTNAYENEIERFLREYPNGITLTIENISNIFNKCENLLDKEFIIRHIKCPKLLEVLSKDIHFYVRHSVAKNPNTPIGALEVLSKDIHFYVRGGGAFNLNTPIETLKVRSKDIHYFVRQAVAGNLNTPIDILEVLSKDSNHLVTRVVAGNPNI